VLFKNHEQSDRPALRQPMRPVRLQIEESRLSR
jgi:hypothetical protein